MSILLAVIGATIGAVIGSLFMHWRSDVAKERQQLESKTPYDYALTNAINERDRLQDELITIQALKRIEADTERIRNEIGTILSDDGEEASEDVYERNIGMPIRDNGDGTFSPITWDNRISSEEMVDNISKAFARDTLERERSRAVVKSCYGMSTEEAAWDAGAVARAYQANVREDGSEDERLTEDDVEHSLTKAVKDSFENRKIILVTWRDSYGSIRFRCGRVDKIATGDGKVKEFGMRGLEIHARDVIRITKGDDIIGETLYRKGNR